jgi:branched-chain amino acid transport system ATP-binding protein
MTAHLACRDLTVRFGGIVACSGLTLSVEQGQIVALIGPNGAGKTTLFNVFSRLQRQDGGHVLFRGETIDDRRPHEMATLGMARTFQNVNLFAGQTTQDNILVGAHRLTYSVAASLLGLPRVRRRERALLSHVRDIAAMLWLEHVLDSPVGNLPYGYQKRVELARALAAQPELILLDEPVAGCNEEETAELKLLIHRINKEQKITVLLVEHNMSMVMDIADYIYVINFGANLAQGTPAEVRGNPAVIAAYLGDDSP